MTIFTLAAITLGGCFILVAVDRFSDELRALRTFFQNTMRHFSAEGGGTLSRPQFEHAAIVAGLMAPKNDGVKLTSVGRKVMKGTRRNNLKAAGE